MQHFGFPLETIIVFFGVVLFSIYIDLISHRHTKEITVKKCGGMVAFLDIPSTGFLCLSLSSFRTGMGESLLSRLCIGKKFIYR